MGILKHKIDFVALVSATMANPNGDPLNGNSPRTDYNGYGEMSDVCIKRKICNRMQDQGQAVFVQSEDRSGDGCNSLSERASSVLGKIKDRGECEKKACETWLDVRSFGQVFAFKDAKGMSVGVRGPVSVHQSVSISPIQVEDMQITKRVNGEKKGKEESRASDTMGMKHFVRFGLYRVKGSINVQLAEKTGFTEEDAAVIKECLRTLFVNDASSARPDGSMEVCRLYWWEHNCKEGQYHGRSRRPPLDRVNALLSFAYSLLANDCASALESVGLDAYVGFLHRDRAGRESLALDLMEELRPCMADRLVLSLINNRVLKAGDFNMRESGAVMLTDDARKTFLKTWQERKQEVITHPYLGEKIPWGLVPYVQALLLARYLRGDLDEYPSFLWK